MKFIIITLGFLSFCSGISVSTTGKNQTLKITREPVSLNMNDEELEKPGQLIWKKRLILVTENGDIALDQLTGNEKEVIERDIVWFRLKNGKVNTNFQGKVSENFTIYLKKNYFEKFNEKAFLIGKDGGLKSKDKTFDLKDYFLQIDAMPMRKREMERDSKN